VSKATGPRLTARAQEDDCRWVASYRPQFVAPPVWFAVRPFVLEAAQELGLVGGASDVRVVRVFTRLVAWAVGEGLALDREVVLDPDTVERFVIEGLADDRSRATYRSVLRRVGPQLTRTAPWEPRPDAVARRQVAPPYTVAELSRLRVAAEDQPTAGRCRAARALLALGAGAGLDGRWVTRVFAGDVSCEDGVVLVQVGDPAPRSVSVLAAWEAEVLDLAASAGTDALVGGCSKARNRAGSLAASLLVGHGTPRFSAARLRSTWLVAHLAAGTRLPDLVGRPVCRA